MMQTWLLLAALGQDAASAPDPLSVLHPADADLYIELGDAQRMMADWQQFPWMQMLRDPEMEKLYALIAGFGVDLRSAFNSTLPRGMLEEGSPLRSMQALNISLAGLDESGAPMEAWLGMRMATAEQASAMISMMESQGLVAPAAIPAGAPAPTLELAGRTLPMRRYELESDRIPGQERSPIAVKDTNMWLVQDGASVMMGVGAAAPADLVERWKGSQPSLPAAAQLFPSDLPWSKPSGLTLYRLWVDIEGQALLSMPSFVEAREALGTTLSWAMPILFPYLGAKGTWRVEWNGKSFVTETVHKRYPSMSTQAMGNAPVDGKVARFIPAEAVGAWITSIEPTSFERELRQLVAAAMQDSDEEPALLTPEQLAALPSLNPGLGRQAAMFLLPISSIQSIEPRLFVAIELENREAFEKALDAWVEKLESIAPGARVSNRPYRKHKLVSLSGATEEEEKAAEGAGGPLGGLMSTPSFSPTIGVLADRVLITVKKSFAQSEMRRVLDGKDTAPHMLAGAGMVPSGAFEASTMDWPAYTGKLLDISKGLLPMAASMMGAEAPQVDVAGLPSTATLQRYFQPSTSWSRRLDDGRIWSTSTSSYGPETPMTMVALILSMPRALEAASTKPTEVEPGVVENAAVTAPQAPKPAAPVESNEELATRQALIEVRAGIAVYRADAGKIPAQLALLTQPTPNFPEAFLNGKQLPQDGWKHDLVYKPEADGKKYVLYSLGANGRDESGEGDDIRLK